MPLLKSISEASFSLSSSMWAAFHLSKGRDCISKVQATATLDLLVNPLKKHFQGNKSQPPDFLLFFTYPLIDFCLGDLNLSICFMRCSSDRWQVKVGGEEEKAVVSVSHCCSKARIKELLLKNISLVVMTWEQGSFLLGFLDRCRQAWWTLAWLGIQPHKDVTAPPGRIYGCDRWTRCSWKYLIHKMMERS